MTASTSTYASGGTLHAPTTVEAVGGLEDDGTLEGWLRRHRDPQQFSKGVRVRTSPKRTTDPVHYGTVQTDPVRDGTDWKVHVRWDDYFRDRDSFGTDIRSLYPLETY